MAAEDDDGSSSFGVAVERKRSEIRRIGIDLRRHVETFQQGWDYTHLIVVMEKNGSVGHRRESNCWQTLVPEIASVC
ncbi:hypothetical protein F8388_007864 [Cannabis sativa]|uniref:Uncharacterized protein n=1 Tax=Cannabis sativa TaxID=3483 RepID=A0A7J6FTJ4_CANSA|nr:hypothetical protein F8388_007864 [Cannabis sativa]